MDAANQFTRAAVFAGQTVRRLEREGLPVEEAKRLVTAVINEEEIRYNRARGYFDETGCIERLRQLPDTSLPSESNGK